MQKTQTRYVICKNRCMVLSKLLGVGSRSFQLRLRILGSCNPMIITPCLHISKKRSDYEFLCMFMI